MIFLPAGKFFQERTNIVATRSPYRIVAVCARTKQVGVDVYNDRSWIMWTDLSSVQLGQTAWEKIDAMFREDEGAMQINLEQMKEFAK